MDEAQILPGYTKDITGDLELGFTVTNTYDGGEQIEVLVTKKWEDQNGEAITDKLPAEVEVALKGTDNSNRPYTLNAANEWKHNFADLPTYDTDGELIKYTAEEVTMVDGYKAEVSGDMTAGFTITNTYDGGEQIEVLVTKKWEDQNGDPITDKLPAEVEVALKGTDSSNRPYTLTGEGEWKHTFTELPSFDTDGKAIIYTAEEVTKVDGYTAEVSGDMAAGFTITNTYDGGEQIKIAVTKKWVDQNGDPITDKLPAEVGVSLKGTDDSNRPYTLNAANEWKHTFAELPSYDTDGQAITYTAEEVTKVDGYKVDVSGDMAAGFIITNTYDGGEQIEVAVTKAWLDQDGEAITDKLPAEVEVSLKGTDDSNRPYTLNAANEWKHNFADLPTYDTDGELIKYTAEEVTKVDGYEVEVSGDMTAGFTITNTYDGGEQIKIAVTKKWEDQNGDPITDKLPAEVGVSLKGTDNSNRSYNLNTAEEWKHTFTDLPSFDTDGQAITYTVEEVIIPNGYKAEVSGDMAAGFTITNTYDGGEQIEVSVIKKWEDQNGDPITDKLPAEVEVALKGSDDSNRPYTLNAANEWKFTFTELPRYDTDGKAIIYTAEEVAVPNGYTVSTTGDMAAGFIITNTYNGGEQIEIAVTKAWLDQDGEPITDKLPVEVEVALKGTDNSNRSYTLNAANEWKHSFTELPRYDTDGKTIIYTAEEVTVVDGYKAEVSGDMTAGFTITNTYDGGEQIEVSVIKKWEDQNGDSITDKLPAEVEVALKGTDNSNLPYTLNAANEWKHTFADLPSFDTNGQAITYTAEEVTVPNGYKASTSGDMTTGFTITNTYDGGEQIEVAVTKVWIDQDGEAITDKLPAEVEVALKGTDGSNRLITLDVANEWKHTFAELPTYDTDGKAIIYTAEEVTVPNGYKAEVSGDMSAGFTITNTYDGGEQIEIAVTKKWADQNGDPITDKLPAEVEVSLKGTDNSNRPYTLNAAEEWKHTFADLPSFDTDGRAITYTAEEVIIPNGYKASTSGDMTTGFTITNTYDGGEQTEVAVAKKWEDQNGDPITDKLPAEVEVALKGTDDSNRTYTLTGEGEWKHTFTELPSFDTDGKAIIYAAEEVTKVDGYTVEVSGDMEAGFTIGNTYDGGEQIEVSVIKKWEDQNGDPITDKLPAEVEVALKGTDSSNRSYTLNAANEWKHTFTTLPSYDTDGKAITYTAEELTIPNGYKVEVSGDMTAGFTITNTYDGGEQIEIAVTKKWVDQNGEAITDNALLPAETEIVLNGSDDSNRPYTLTGEGEWKHTFTGLPSYYTDGKAIIYTVEEVTVPNGYQATVEGFTITNKYDGVSSDDGDDTNDTTISVKATKSWVYPDGVEEPADADKPEVAFKLTRSDAELMGEKTPTSETWAVTWTDLLRFDTKGEGYTYEATEVAVPNGYKVEVSGDMAAGFTITNTYDGGEQIEVSVIKKWEDQNGDPITDKLPAEVEVDLKGTDSSNRSYTLNAANEWKHTFTNLPSYDTDGKAITYTAEEVTVPNGYEAEVSGDMAAGFTITNTYDGGEKISVEFVKVWIGLDGEAITDNALLPAEVEVALKGTDDSNRTYTLTGEGEWKHTFAGLPSYDTDGKAITYTAEEVTVPNGYKASTSGDMTTGFTITNKYDGVSTDDGDNTNDTTISVKATKSWVYPDGVEEPADADKPAVQFVLTRSDDKSMGEKTPSHTTTHPWEVTWTDLLRFDTKGEGYSYEATEVAVPNGYIDSVTGDMTSGFVITNAYDGGESILVDVTKAWIGLDGQPLTDNTQLPAQVDILLKGSDGSSIPKILNAKNSWKHSFTDLPSFDTDGEIIDYTAEEVTVPAGYKASTSGDMSAGFTLTNTYTGQDQEGRLLNIQVTKVWVDNKGEKLSNPADLPKSLDVTLKDDQGQTYTHSLSADSQGAWTHVFTDLLAINTAGEAITYTLSETLPDGFEFVDLSGNQQDGFQLTNRSTLLPATEETTGGHAFNLGDTIE